MKLFYTDRAREDVQVAYAWYEKCQSGLGEDFLTEMEFAINLMLEQPRSYPIVYDCFRRCPLKRFPYSIFYTLEGQNILVHAVFDQRQNPAKYP